MIKVKEHYDLGFGSWKEEWIMEKELDTDVMKKDLKNMRNFCNELYMIFNSTEDGMTAEQKAVSDHYKVGIRQIERFLAKLESSLS